MRGGNLAGDCGVIIIGAERALEERCQHVFAHLVRVHGWFLFGGRHGAVEGHFLFRFWLLNLFRCNLDRIIHEEASIVGLVLGRRTFLQRSTLPIRYPPPIPSLALHRLREPTLVLGLDSQVLAGK